MITINNNQLCICIPGLKPEDTRECLIKSLAAAIRWRASYNEDYNGDDTNLMYLSILLAGLANPEE